MAHQSKWENQTRNRNELLDNLRLSLDIVLLKVNIPCLVDQMEFKYHYDTFKNIQFKKTTFLNVSLKLSKTKPSSLLHKL